MQHTQEMQSILLLIDVYLCLFKLHVQVIKSNVLYISYMIVHFIHDNTWHCVIVMQLFFLYFLRCYINNKLTTITECFRCKCLVFAVHRLCVCFVPDQIWHSYVNLFNVVSIVVNVNLSHTHVHVHLRSNTFRISWTVFI